MFTFSDLKTMVLPETAFGIFSALAPRLTTNGDPKVFDILSRLPQTILWVWMNLLLFNIANQRLPDSIVEDRINKPWRAIPAGRLTPKEARRLLLVVIPLVFIGSLFLGGTAETVILVALTWIYNDLGGADEVYFVRNAVNAFGLMGYSSGSMNVAAGGVHHLTPDAYKWIALVGGVVFSTISMQDLPDIKGDAIRGRRTSPLVMGDSWTRWEIAIPIFLWSVICPFFWKVALAVWIIPVGVGAWLAFRILCFRTVTEDKVSWRTWCFWTGVLYALPLFGN